MIKKPSGLDLKYQDLGTEEAIREYERDTMLWEMYINATKKEFNPLTDLKATYYPDIDDEDYDDEDYEIIEAMRNKLGKLLDKRDYYETESEYTDNTIGVCFTILGIIGVICVGPISSISTPLCVTIACLIPIFFHIYYTFKRNNAKAKLQITKKQITNLKKEIKAMQKKQRK